MVAVKQRGYNCLVISIGLIEDNRLVREGIAALLTQHGDLTVVLSAAGHDTSNLRDTRPHVILLDVGLDRGSSLRIAERLQKESPASKIIVMDVVPVHEEIVEFVNVGVSGFIMKDATLDDLVRTIRAVAGGAHVLPPQMTTTLFTQIAKDAMTRGGRSAAMESVRMTPREREVINLIAEGLGNKEIAARLHIATDTVKSHVRNIMEKLMLHTRLQIAAFAHREST